LWDREWFEADVPENIADVTQLLAAGRCRLRIEIEDLSIFDPVIGESRDPSLLVEIDCDDTLVGNLVWHERDGALGLLRNVVESVTTDGCHRGWRAKHNENLLLRCADRNLLKSAFRQHVAALQRLGGAAAGRECQHACERECQMETSHDTTHGPRPRSVSLNSCTADGVDVTRVTAAAEQIR
jgi:hypothetical protein